MFTHQQDTHCYGESLITWGYNMSYGWEVLVGWARWGGDAENFHMSFEFQRTGMKRKKYWMRQWPKTFHM